MRGLVVSLAILGVGCVGRPVDISEAESAVQVCPGKTVLEGIDVSQYQGTIDWTAVAKSGRAFAIARVGDGLGNDPTFAANWSGMKAAGMVRGVYQFFRAGADPIAQADLLLGKIGTLGAGDLAPALDVEVTDGQSAATITQNMTKWLTHVEQKTGRVPLIYSSPGFWSSIGSPNFSHDVLWVANWQVNCPNTPGGWTAWSFWQYSDTGSVPGISGAVDLDRFDGDAAALMGIASPPNLSTDGGAGDGGQVTDGGPAVDGATAADAAPSSIGDGGGAGGNGHVPPGPGKADGSGNKAAGGCSVAGSSDADAALAVFVVAALLVRRRRFARGQ